MTADLDQALNIFAAARLYVERAELGAEVEWQRKATIEGFTEPELLREAAWVILCSGFREALVRRCFDQISLCFCDWESASEIIASYPACKLAARSVFANNAKLDAILGVARRIQEVSFRALKQAIVANPIFELRQLPYIGAVTVWHLAKNLGLNVVKPDRHLVRISRHLGFADPNAFCRAVGQATNEEPKIVDLIVWRFLADNPSLRRQWA